MTRRIAIAPLCLAAGMLSLAGTAGAQAPLLEVEKSDATKLLQVNDDAGFVVRGKLEVGTTPAAGAGVRLMWYPGRGAFRAGVVSGSEWDEENIGSRSVALGGNTRATGLASLALNQETLASGHYSIAGGIGSIASGAKSLAVGDRVVASGIGAAALGLQTVASGQSSLAVGDNVGASGIAAAALGARTVASGDGSFAAGSGTKASGSGSMAMGAGAVAAGLASVALGSGVTAKGDGSFAFGDRNIGFQHTPGPNEFWVRAFGGIGLNTGVGIGCDLPPNTGAWACTSSKLVKEAFEDVDGEEILARLKAVPIQRWRYIGTEARHLGPFAEDFRAAFGLGDGEDKIAQIDADGVALSAVQALERRTAELQAENAALKAETAELRAGNTAQRTETSELRRRIEALEGSGHGR